MMAPILSAECPAIQCVALVRPVPVFFCWVIVTTTAGYGGGTPHTVLGSTVAATAMILGYSPIIIPTGSFATERVRTSQRAISTEARSSCSREGHEADVPAMDR